MVGHEVGRETFLDGQIRARQLRDQSENIVDRMKRCGLQGRPSRDAVSIIGLVSGQVERATDFCNCTGYPSSRATASTAY